MVRPLITLAVSFTATIRHHQALGTAISVATLTRIRATLRAALNIAA
jgi:hypothetical protein